MTTARVALGYKGLNATELTNYTDTIYTSINGNTNFTALAGFIPLLFTANGKLKTAITNLKPGDKVTTSTLHDTEREVRRLLRVIAAIVEFESNGNETLILSSGYSLRAITLPSTKNFNAKQGVLSGTVDLEINSYGSAAYVWEISPDPIGTWSPIALTTVSKTTVSALTPGVKYWFRVSITKGTTKLATSDPYMVHVV